MSPRAQLVIYCYINTSVDGRLSFWYAGFANKSLSLSLSLSLSQLQLHPAACTAASSREVDPSVPPSWQNRYSNFWGRGPLSCTRKPLLRHSAHLESEQRPPKSVTPMSELLASIVATLMSIHSLRPSWTSTSTDDVINSPVRTCV